MFKIELIKLNSKLALVCMLFLLESIRRCVKLRNGEK